MIEVWTDGCSLGNPGRSGAGIIIILPNGKVGRFSRRLYRGTNNRAEILAVHIALGLLFEYVDQPITIHTDSRNVIGWLTGKFRVNDNVVIISKTRQRLKKFSSVSFEKVKGHAKIPLNEDADILARNGASGFELSKWGSMDSAW